MAITFPAFDDGLSRRLDTASVAATAPYPLYADPLPQVQVDVIKSLGVSDSDLLRYPRQYLSGNCDLQRGTYEYRLRLYLLYFIR